MNTMFDFLQNAPNQYVAIKDQNSKFICCNDNFSEAAGLDSPQQIKNKRDCDLIWRANSDLYETGDRLIIQGDNLINMVEPQQREDTLHKILVSKTQLRNKNGNCCGTIVGFIDITGHSLQAMGGYYDQSRKRFYLGEAFDNRYLTKSEYSVFKYLCLGNPMKKIATRLNISIRTVEAHVNSIKVKLNCNYKYQIMEKAIKYKFLYALIDDE